MKYKLLWVLITLSNSSIVEAQNSSNSVDLLYNYSHIGQSISANWNFNCGEKHTFVTGIKYHMNMPINDNRGFLFRHRFYSENAFQSLGLNLGYERHFKFNESAIEPYVFYLLQASHGMRARFTTEVCDTVNWNVEHRTAYTGQLYSLEHGIGVGFTVKACKNLYLNQSVGIGVVNIWEKFTGLFDKTYYNYSWEIADVYRVGLTYKFGNSKGTP